MLHPGYPELARRLRAAAPAGSLDQADAAADHAARGMAVLAGLLDAEGVRAAVPEDIPGWLRLGVIDTFVGWLTGRGETCLHNPHPRRPKPVLAAAWRPGLITRVPCGFLFRVGGEADSTCDSCGRQCASDGGLYPGAVQCGPLIYLHGVCPDCRPLSATLSQDLGPVVSAPRVRPRGGRGRGRGKGERR